MKNWKTTLAGILTALVIALQPLVTIGEFKWYNVLLACTVAILGFVAKDFDKTGI